MKKLNFLLLFLLGLAGQSLAQCPNFNRSGIHVVQSGENLYRIAIRYNLTTFEIAQWNNMPADATLYACQELIVSPPSSDYPPPPVTKDYSVERSPGNTTTNYNTYNKQAGNRHTIQAGEQIANLARLYGYTEERFRKINLLKPGEEPTVGTIILSSDCACDRIVTYDEFGNNYSSNTYIGPINSGSSSSSNTSIRSNQDDFYNRGTTNYDNFYDTNQGAYGGDSNINSNPPAPVPIDNNRIRSAGTNNPTPTNFNTGSGNTRIASRPAGAPAPVNAAYMSSEELAMLDEINLMRSNPVAYIPYVEQYKRDIRSGKSFGSSIEVCDELIAELRRTPPLSILKPAPCIYNAAKKHGLDQKARGNTGHDGSDGSWPWDRVKRECPQMTDGNENLVGGPADVREAVILLLVDDGIPSRGHRKTLLNKDWVYGTTYKIGKVGYMPNCWVQKFGF